MKKLHSILFGPAIAVALCISACGGESGTSNGAAKTEETTTEGGQASVQDNESAKDVVKIAVGSKDHTTLVAAVKAAELVDDLANAGPFTVFAPTNAAFDALPAGTVEGLLKPEKKKDLQNILQYHVGVGKYSENILQDGQELFTAAGPNVKITKKDGKIKVNDANIVATIEASNGIVYVIDKVLLPPAK